MIIEAATSEGSKAKIYLKDGTLCDLLISRYNTETQEATVYEQDENGRVKLTDWASSDGKMYRTPITKKIILEGSYAEIDGERV